MQKAFEKIIEIFKENISNLEHNQKLFEKKKCSNMMLVCESEVKAYMGAIEIVNQVAEEYKHKLSICNNSFYENMPQDFQDAVKVIMGYCQHEDCAYSCDDCSNCPNPLSVIRCGDTWQNDGWIPCSERLPSREEYQKCNGQFIVSDGNRTYATYFDIYDTLKFGEPTIERFRVDKCVIAWQPLPERYQPKEIAKDCNNCANYTEPDEVDNGCYMCCKGLENNYQPKGE